MFIEHHARKERPLASSEPSSCPDSPVLVFLISRPFPRGGGPAVATCHSTALGLGRPRPTAADGRSAVHQFVMISTRRSIMRHQSPFWRATFSACLLLDLETCTDMVW